jgi:hypothetical protein
VRAKNFKTRDPPKSAILAGTMKPNAAALLTFGILAAAAPARATSNYDYKPHEYVIVDGGRAPNQRVSLAAHGSEDLGYGFHVYLMVEPAHKVIAALPSIDDHAILDTAADAYHATWSPDSRYVALNFRSDRHVLTLCLFDLRTRHPRLLDVPVLFHLVTKLPEDSDDFETRTDITQLTWLSATTFTLTQRRVIEVKAPDVTQKLGSFGKPYEDKSEDAPKQPERNFMTFSAVASGEILPGGRVRVSDIKPSAFD